MILIAKETPHMFMWFSDGSKIPAGISPLPHNTKLDYIKRLKEECAKLLITKTPVYLVYMGRLLSAEQKTCLENLQNEIPNLAVIDYDEVEQNISDPQTTHKVAVTANAYKEHERLDVGRGGIADLVDLTRLILLYNSKILRDIARKKISIPLEWREGLIYRDFDVTLKKEMMSDIPTTHGYMATLNFLAQVQESYTRFIASAIGNDDLLQRIDEFFKEYIYNLENYQKILKLFLARPSSASLEQAKQDFLLKYQAIFQADNFEFVFIDSIRIENSFLAISTDQHPLIRKMIEGVVLKEESPYAVVQLNLCFKFNRLDRFKEFLTPQQLGFHIGNDLTWKISVKEQHIPENVTVDTLKRTTSEMYLAHQNEFFERTKKQAESHAVLDDTKNSFDQLFAILTSKIEELKTKGDPTSPSYNKNYDTVSATAEILQNKLIRARDNFFVHHTLTKQQFKKNCYAAINEAKEAFSEHRQYWFQVQPILRKILGVIAILSIVPAITVKCLSKNGFFPTFFGTPTTDSGATLQAFRQGIQSLTDNNSNVLTQPDQLGSILF